MSRITIAIAILFVLFPKTLIAKELQYLNYITPTYEVHMEPSKKLLTIVQINRDFRDPSSAVRSNCKRYSSRFLLSHILIKSRTIFWHLDLQNLDLALMECQPIACITLIQFP
jgi:hypothetical protein